MNGPTNPIDKLTSHTLFRNVEILWTNNAQKGTI